MLLVIFFGSFLGEPVWAAIGIDATSSGDKGTATNTVSNTQAFSTSASNELLLAFVSTDYLSGTNTTVTGVSGAGLSWALVVRTNTQSGTSEIWRAFATAPLSNVTVTATLSQKAAASITVMSFTGVDTSGTNGSGAIGATKSTNSKSGAPTATLTTTRAGSWVLGVGNDYDNAIARTPGSNQNLVHQYLAPVGDTYWVQRQNNPTPLSGTSVTINDTAPTGDRYNLSIVEILPLVSSGGTTYSISGAITSSANGAGATVALQQNGTSIATVIADSSGNYSFANLANGSYTVIPSKAGYTFSPQSLPVTINGANVSGINFTATPASVWSISGTISPLPGGSGTLLTLSGASNSTVTADSSGNYSFVNLANGSYTVTPSKVGYTFTPQSQAVTINGANASGINFAAQPLSTGINFVQGSTNGSETTIASIAQAFTSSNTQGNLLVVTGTAARPSATLSISDTAGNAYGVAVGPITDPVQNVTAYVWYVPNCKGGPNTVTITPSTPGALEIHISEFSGADSGSPLDQTSVGIGTGFNISSGTKTTTVNGELIFGYDFAGDPNSSVGSGFTGLSYVNGDWDEYQIQNTIGSVAATFTQPSNSPWLALMATFKPSTSQAVATTDWLTYGHDPQRSGNAAGESVINPTSVKNLALKWSASLDNKVTAQPLFVSAVSVGGQTRDIVVAATANNSVYALDANTGSQLWQKHFGTPSGQGDVPGGFGISGTPVIDKTAGRIYTVTDDGNLRALRLADGQESYSPYLVIQDNQGTNSVWGGLNLVGKNLYIATSSNGPDTQPWWGRIIQVDVSGATPVIANTFKVVPSIAAPNGGGGIWGYGGVSVDPVSGRVFAATAADNILDSTQTEGYTPYAGRMLALNNNIGLLGSYEPPHPSPCPGSPGACDMDFGATPIIFQPPGCGTLVAAVNKDGRIHKLNADDLAAGATTSLQSLALNSAYDGPGAGGLIGVPAYWPLGNMLYVTDGLDYSILPGISGINAGVIGLKVAPSPSCALQVAWSVDWTGKNGGPVLTRIDQPPSSPTVANGVVFVGSGVNGSVHAYDATNGTELWNSGNTISGASFTAPTVVNGTLYAASWNGFNASDGGKVTAFTPGAVPPPSSTVLLGDQTIESQPDSNALGSAEAFQAIASASGTVSSLSIYIDASSTATALVTGLYSDSGTGHPGALIAQGNNTSSLTAGTWNTIPISGASITQGTRYWIAMLGTQSGTLHFRDAPTGGCSSETSTQNNLTVLPPTWSTGATWPGTCLLSAYGR
ncbi:MAG: beta strand repeat-containing protein [Methylobacter sp.]